MLPPDVVNPDVAESDDALPSASDGGFAQSGQSLSPQPWSIDAYADSLMDELFEEVDRILEGGSPVLLESRSVETVALHPVSIPKIMMPPVLSSSSALAPGGTVDTLATPLDPSSEKKSLTSGLERLLLLGLCGATAIVGLVWLANQKGMQLALPFLSNQPFEKAATTTVAQTAERDADAQFLDYIQRSLELLGQRPVPSTVVASAPTPSTALPSVTVAANTAPTPASAPAPATVLERIYVPVYQPPQLGYNAPVLPSAPIAGNPQSVTVPVPPIAAAPVPLPVFSNTLIGVLELGNRSAALFEINGMTQRVNVGEEIGASGWTLVKVANKEAVIRRNGEVRSVYVGQKF